VLAVVDVFHHKDHEDHKRGVCLFVVFVVFVVKLKIDKLAIALPFRKILDSIAEPS